MVEKGRDARLTCHCFWVLYHHTPKSNVDRRISRVQELLELWRRDICVIAVQKVKAGDIDMSAPVERFWKELGRPAVRPWNLLPVNDVGSDSVWEFFDAEVSCSERVDLPA